MLPWCCSLSGWQGRTRQIQGQGRPTLILPTSGTPPPSGKMSHSTFPSRPKKRRARKRCSRRPFSNKANPTVTQSFEPYSGSVRMLRRTGALWKNHHKQLPCLRLNWLLTASVNREAKSRLKIKRVKFNTSNVNVTTWWSDLSLGKSEGVWRRKRWRQLTAFDVGSLVCSYTTVVGDGASTFVILTMTPPAVHAEQFLLLLGELLTCLYKEYRSMATWTPGAGLMTKSRWTRKFWWKMINFHGLVSGAGRGDERRRSQRRWVSGEIHYFHHFQKSTENALFQTPTPPPSHLPS